MAKSVEQRLQDLQVKREAIDAQIKDIQAKKSAELRRRQQRREQLLGRAVYQLVEQREWTEEQLLALVSRFITTPRDRALFGLSPLESRTSNREESAKEKSAPLSPDAAVGSSPKSRAKTDTRPLATASSPVPKADQDVEQGETSSDAPTPRLRVPDNQGDLASEFNL